MAERQRADDRLQQVLPPRFQHRKFRAKRGRQFSVDPPPLFDPEDVDPRAVGQNLLMSGDRERIVAQPGQTGVRPGEQVVVDRQPAAVIERPGSEVGRRLQRHMAAVAIILRRGRVVEAPRAVARHTAEQVRVVVILAAQELLVVGQFLRQVHLMADRAELRLLVKRLQERLLVKRRLRLHHLPVDRLQQRVVAVGERIVERLFDSVVGVAAGAVDVRHRMAHGAGDARVGGGVVLIVEVGIVEGPAEERHRVVAAGAPTRRLDVAVAGERGGAGLPHAGQVGRVVEGTEAVGAVVPAVVHVLVALHTVSVHHQRLGRNEVARCSAGQRGARSTARPAAARRRTSRGCPASAARPSPPRLRRRRPR